MTKFVYIFLLFTLLSSSVFAGTPWENYLSLPNSENATKVLNIEYTSGVIPENYGYWSPDLEILRTQVLAGDAEAIKLTYRLIQKSDGGLLEDLISILNSTIRVRPEFFLIEMSKINPSRDILKFILLKPGSEYVDRRDAQEYEIKMREKALLSVSDGNAKAFKDICLEIIKSR
jgi:hypothetical protein